MDLSKLEGIRKRALLTQEELSFLLGITRQTYNNWIRGRSQPRRGQRDRLRWVLLKISTLLRMGHWPPTGIRAMGPQKRLEKIVAEMSASNGEEHGYIYLPGEGIT